MTGRSYTAMERDAHREADECLRRAEEADGQVGKREWLEAADRALQVAQRCRVIVRQRP